MSEKKLYCSLRFKSDNKKVNVDVIIAALEHFEGAFSSLRPAVTFKADPTADEDGFTMITGTIVVPGGDDED